MIRTILLSLALSAIVSTCNAQKNCATATIHSSQKEAFATFYEHIPTIRLPFEYSYNFILDLPNTICPNKEAMNFIATCVDADTDLSICRIAKLPSTNNWHLFLIFGNNQTGERRIFLCALDSKYNLTNKLLIYTAKDVQWKGKIENYYLHYTIMPDNSVILKEMIATPGKPKLVRKRIYSFSKGKFKLRK